MAGGRRSSASPRGTSRSVTTAASPRPWSSRRAALRGDGGPVIGLHTARRSGPRKAPCSPHPRGRAHAAGRRGWPPSACGCSARVYGRRVVLLVGSGNNGGDALFAGAHLAAVARVTAVLLDPDRAHASPDGRCAQPVAAAWCPPDPAVATLASRADLVLDGILGIGGTGWTAACAVESGRRGRDRRGDHGRGRRPQRCRRRHRRGGGARVRGACAR